MSDNNKPPAVNRRNVLKATAAGGLLGAGSVGTVVSASDAEGQEISPEDRELPNPNVERTVIDRSVKAAVPHWDLLTLPADTVQRYIKRSEFSPDEQREAIDALTELRRRFPTKRVQEDSNVTRVTLATDRGASEEDTRLAKTAHRPFADGTSFGGGHSQWTKDNHEDMAQEACWDMGIDGEAETDIIEGSDNPDEWNVQLQVPDAIPHEETVRDGLETGLNYLLRYYGQYFDPGVFEIYHTDNHDVDFGELGGAPAAADLELYYANYYDDDARYGRATHYFADMGVPLHTSMGWEQVNLEIVTNSDGTIDFEINPMYWLHGEYEKYVADNFYSGEYFYYQFGSNDCSADYCYYDVSNTEQAIKDCADVTENYSYDMYHKILDEGDVGWSNWSSSTKDWMRDTTENCLDTMGLYFRGTLQQRY